MKTTIQRLALFAPLMVALGGCATKALWQSGDLEAFKEPAPKPNVRLFQTVPMTNFLVVYDEMSERSDAVKTRAFWLNQNEDRIGQGQRPRFVDPRASRGLDAVPIVFFSAATNLPQGCCATVATNAESFTIFRDRCRIGAFPLPVYNDGRGRVEKAALTPVALTADATILGGYLGFCFIEGLANSTQVYSIAVKP